MADILEQHPILYVSDEDRLPLPHWATFYFKLGEALANINIYERRFVVAISAPARAFTAPFVAAGIILTRANLTGEFRDDKHYIDALRKLPIDTPVRFRQGNKRKRGFLQGFRTFNNMEYVGIKAEEATVRWFTLDKVRTIEVADTEFTNLPKRQRGRDIVSMSTLAGSIVQQEMVHEFYQHSQLDCLFIARRPEFREVVEQTKLVTRSSNGLWEQGELADLLRIDSLLGAGSAYRSELVSASCQESKMDELSSSMKPYVVLFDSNLGYSKWSPYWQTANHIVVLDRTESQRFDSALEILNREALHTRTSTPLKIEFPPIPVAIDIMAYEVPVHD